MSEAHGHFYHNPDPAVAIDNPPRELFVAQNRWSESGKHAGWSAYTFGYNLAWCFDGEQDKERAEQWLLTNGYRPADEKRRRWVRDG